MIDQQLSQAALLNNALAVIENELTAWGIDNYLGYRPPDHGIIRLSVSGATNIAELINIFNREIERLTSINKSFRERLKLCIEQVNELDGGG
jgi:hypothetical protein